MADLLQGAVAVKGDGSVLNNGGVNGAHGDSLVIWRGVRLGLFR